MGEKKDTYFIQKKLLFFWRNISVKYFYLSDTKRYETGAILQSWYYSFESLNSVNLVYESLLNPVEIKYKGNKIKAMLDRDHFKPRWINLSNVLEVNSIGQLVYQQDENLDKLKEKIDKEILTVSKQIITP